MAPLTGAQSSLTGEARLFAPLAGVSSCGASDGQLCARGIVKRDTAERTEAHPSSTASTNQRYEPEGSARVTDVSSSVSPACTDPAPPSQRETRSSTAPGTAFQPSV